MQYLCDINLPTGKIVANDPICMYEFQPLSECVPAGRYPVYIYIQHIKTDRRVALAEIRFTEDIPVRYDFAVTERFANLQFRNIYYMGYGVDSGTGGFMDLSLAESIKNYSNEQSEKLSEKTLEITNETYVHTYSTLNCTPENEEANIVGFSSGWGDGCYESYWGYNEKNQICSLTTYFDTLSLEVEWGPGVNLMKDIVDRGYAHSSKIKKKSLNINEIAGYNHLAVYLRWMGEHGLLNEYLLEEYPALLSVIKEKQTDLRYVLRLVPVFSSRLTLEHFNEAGKEFTKQFYAFNGKGYPRCVDKYAEEVLGTEKYNCEEYKDEAYLFVPYDEAYYQGLSKYIDEAWEEFIGTAVTSGPFVYDEKLGMMAAEINSVRFECEKLTGEMEEMAYQLAGCYKEKLPSIVNAMYDEVTSFFGEMSEEELLNSLGGAVINLDKGLLTYAEHTLDDVHVIDVEFDGMFDEIFEVRVDG